MNKIENVLIRMQEAKEDTVKFKELDKELARLQSQAVGKATEILVNAATDDPQKTSTEDGLLSDTEEGLPLRVRIERKWHFVKDGAAACGIAVTGVDFTIKDFSNFDGNPHRITCLKCRDIYKAQR